MGDAVVPAIGSHGGEFHHVRRLQPLRGGKRGLADRTAVTAAGETQEAALLPYRALAAHQPPGGIYPRTLEIVEEQESGRPVGNRPGGRVPVINVNILYRLFRQEGEPHPDPGPRGAATAFQPVVQPGFFVGIDEAQVRAVRPHAASADQRGGIKLNQDLMVH